MNRTDVEAMGYQAITQSFEREMAVESRMAYMAGVTQVVDIICVKMEEENKKPEPAKEPEGITSKQRQEIEELADRVFAPNPAKVAKKRGPKPKSKEIE